MSLISAQRAISGGWKRLGSGSVNRRILQAVLTVGGLTLGAKILSMGKDALVASAFGLGDALDVFAIAFLLPSYLINVVGGSFNAALIPVYIQVREKEGHEAAQRLFSGIVLVSIVLLAAVTALFALAGPYLLPFLGSGFSAQKMALTRSLFYVLLPTILISGVATIWGAILNAGERFALTSIASIMLPLAIVLFLLPWGHAHDIYALGYGTVAGIVLQSCLLAWGLKKQGLCLWPRWQGGDPALRRVLRQYLPSLAGGTLMSSTLLVDQAIAATLGPGSVAAVGYGNKIVAVVVSLGAAAIGTAVMPYFSRMMAEGDWAGVRHTLRTYVFRVILPATVPVAILLIVFSEPLIRLLFERGAFSAHDTHLVARMQALYALQIPFYIAGILGVRLISSSSQNHILMWICGVNIIINAVGDYLLAQVMGVAGIALSTSIVCVISTTLVFSFIALEFRKRGV